MTKDLSQSDIQELGQLILSWLMSQAQGVGDGDVDVVGSLVNINSLLAYQKTGVLCKIVEAPLSLLQVGIQRTDTHLQWRLGSGSWQNMIPLLDLMGKDFKFSDFTPEQLALLTLTFEKLTPEEKESLKLKFADLSAADIALLQKPATDAAAEVREDMAQISEEANTLKTDLTEFGNTAKQAESGRVVEEGKRVTAEGLRKEEEIARGDAEELREKGESGRITEEGKRAGAETIRDNAEQSRIREEGLRATSEQNRKDVEAARVIVEQGRAVEEGKRSAGEVLRNQSEEVRNIEEGKRDEAELLRAAFEAERAAHEEERIESEDSRFSVELLRVGAESDRVVEEGKRATAETGRDEAEAARKESELLRIQTSKTAVDNANAATESANTSAAAAQEVADHQTYIGEDFYVYKWNLTTKAYDKTNIYTKGEGFSIFRSYTSVELMKEDKANVPEGSFVMINTNDVENPDNAQVYLRNGTSETGFDFVVDMSGAVGFTGKTPQFVVGNITAGIEGSQASMSLSEAGQDEGGNPVYAINLSVPRGDKGKAPIISIGTVATVEPGEAASAQLVPNGTTEAGEPKYILNMALPKGNAGGLETGDALNLTVSFTEATERANISSGEKMSVLFGKIRKFFADLKTVAFTGKFSDLVDKPTTVDGYGITDASKTGHKHAKSDISDFPTSLPASDVSAWAKASAKPTYSATEVGASPSNHNHEGVYQPKGNYSSSSHTHDGTYEPVFAKGTAFNKSFGSTAGTVCQGNDGRLTNARPASDVSGWAKAPTKPAYTAAEVGAALAGHNHNGVYQPAGSYAALGHNHEGVYCPNGDARLSNARVASDVYTWAKQASKPAYAWNEIGGKPSVAIGNGQTRFGSSMVDISTATFIGILQSLGAFNQGYWSARGTWDYAGNSVISDTGIGRIHLAGCTVEVIGGTSNFTIRIITPTTNSAGGDNARVFYYIDNTPGYSPGWFKLARSGEAQPASDVYGWAKASVKPGYSASEVGASPSNHNHSGVYQPVGSYAASSHGHGDATTGAAGFMSAADKQKVNRLHNYITSTTVTSLNVDAEIIYVTLGSNVSLSASAVGAGYNGRTITAFVYCSAAVTIAIPTSGSYMSMCGSSITVAAGKWVEFNLTCVGGVWHIAKLEQE